MPLAVSLRGIHVEATSLTWNLASTIVKADEGKLVTLDTSAANTVKLAGDNDVIYGILQVVEERASGKVGTVEHMGGFKIKTTGTIAVGDSIVGSSTAGVGKTATDNLNNRITVVEVLANDEAVVLML